MDKRLVANLLKKKTHRFLKLSCLVFIISITVINCILLYLTNQYFQVNEDYLTNNNVKVIEVLSRTKNDVTEEATLKEVYEINQYFENNKVAEKAVAYPVYGLKVGLNSNISEKPIFLTGIDQKLDFLIGEDIQLKNSVMALRMAPASKLRIEIPIIEEKNGGMSSNESTEIEFKAITGATNENALFINTVPFNRGYVNLVEFDKILKTMYQQSNNDFDFIKSQSLEKIVVYVKSAKDVDDIGDLLSKQHYDTSYAFSNFSNFTDNLRTGELLLIGLGIIILIASIGSIVLLTFNFLNLNKKEIAILKLIGYQDEVIRYTFTRIIGQNYLSGLLIGIVLFICLALLPVFKVPFYMTLGIIIVDILVYFIIMIVLNNTKIKELSREGIMTLLKKDKEFD